MVQWWPHTVNSLSLLDMYVLLCIVTECCRFYYINTFISSILVHFIFTFVYFSKLLQNYRRNGLKVLAWEQVSRVFYIQYIGKGYIWVCREGFYLESNVQLNSLIVNLLLYSLCLQVVLHIFDWNSLAWHHHTICKCELSAKANKTWVRRFVCFPGWEFPIVLKIALWCTVHHIWWQNI